MARARAAIHAGEKVWLRYADEQGRETERTIWPFAVGYHDAVRLLVAWCELRADFRSFRTDRVVEAKFLEERYPERPGILRARWRKAMSREGHPA
jgi:predicted DNA-binding transcriptional regulator YafY